MTANRFRISFEVMKLDSDNRQTTVNILKITELYTFMYVNYNEAGKIYGNIYFI